MEDMNKMLKEIRDDPANQEFTEIESHPLLNEQIRLLKHKYNIEYGLTDLTDAEVIHLTLLKNKDLPIEQLIENARITQQLFEDFERLR